MTTVRRSFVWIGGALFAGSIAYFVVWYALLLGTRHAFEPAALAIDLGMFSLFALHHTLFARDSVKRIVEHLVPDHLLRSVYVWVASLLFLGVMSAWQRVGGLAYATTGWLRYPLIVLQLGAVWLIARSVGAIDALELAGIRQASKTDIPSLQTSGPYYLVRHPLYLGWIVALFATPVMTGDRLAFAVISSTYLLIAIPWEERSLDRAFGRAYADYKRTVRWRVVPYVY
jgi:protein-S-isoprenylcysteine O-methyltransferase Ste14